MEKRPKRDISINITKRCNLSCPECYVSDFLYTAKQGENVDLSLSKIKEIIDINSLGSVYLTGGEPFAHPEILQIINYFYNNNVKINIATNGLLIADNMLSFLKDLKVKLLISVRKTHKEVFDVINKIISSDIDFEIYHIPELDSVELLRELINNCKEIKKIRLLYDSKKILDCRSWFNILTKINSDLKLYDKSIDIDAEIAFLPYNHPISRSKSRGAFYRVHVDTQGLFYCCPLMILSKNGSLKLPPEKCSISTCPLFVNKVEDSRYNRVCCFLVTQLSSIEKIYIQEDSDR